MEEEPILQRLIKGDRFYYSLLRAERDAVERYREWWWKQGDGNPLKVFDRSVYERYTSIVSGGQTPVIFD